MPSTMGLPPRRPRRVREDDGVTGAAPEPTIATALDEFLALQGERVPDDALADYETILELLASCLNGYGHESLDAGELRRFDEAYEAGDADAYCRLFGPEKILDNLDRFLGDFMTRKVMASEELRAAAGIVTGQLAAWLGERGHTDPARAAAAVARADAAARELPRAERLTGILYELAEAGTWIDFQELTQDDVVGDHLRISRIEPGELWFDDDLGPVRVPKAASDLAEIGWSVNGVLARTPEGWRLLEVGNVYPG